MAATPPEGVESGLFSSSVHAQQTNRHVSAAERRQINREHREHTKFLRDNPGIEYRLPPATPAEITFRHRGWSVDRERVRIALVAGGAGQHRLDRFQQCGGDCVVEYSQDAGRHRLRANYCGDRMCKPCGTARAKKLERELLGLIGVSVIRFVTLTLAATGEPLTRRYDLLFEAFRRLRARAWWKSRVKSGFYFVETTRNEKTANWHVHLHVLVAGGWLDQAELREEWKAASAGSFIVYVQPIPDLGRQVAYACKYASKGWSQDIAKNPESLMEFWLSTRGRRMFSSFGEWRGVARVERESDFSDWVRVGRLTDIIDEAEKNTAWAVGVLRSIVGNDLPARTAGRLRLSG